MAIPIIKTWKNYFSNPHEGLGSSYERIVLNDLLLYLKRTYRLTNVLEAPIFGFTGMTGLNSVVLAQHGCNVTLVETDPERAQLVKDMLDSLNQKIRVKNVDHYTSLPYSKGEFDFSWNFSALWFVEDLHLFLSELTRITSKVIMLCVPNQSGLGYKWQKAHADVPEDLIFNETYINPDLVKSEMLKFNWTFVKEAYIDCPLWPDIGTTKESFYRSLTGKIPLGTKRTIITDAANTEQPKASETVSIMDYYRGNDIGFPDRMRKYSAFEEWAPVCFKKIWSHHRWMVFTAPDS